MEGNHKLVAYIGGEWHNRKSSTRQSQNPYFNDTQVESNSLDNEYGHHDEEHENIENVDMNI